MQTQTLNNYQPSGKIGVTIFVSLPLMIAAALVLSYIYIFLIKFIPFIYITFFIYVGFVAALMATAAGVVILGRIRNSFVGLLSGLVIGLLALYAQWLISLPHIAGLLGETTTTQALISDPAYMWDLMGRVANVGWFSIFSVDISGMVLWIIWIIEAVGIIIFPTVTGSGQVQTRVYCESCSKWAKEKEGVLNFYHENDKELQAQFSSGNSSFLNAATPIDAQPTHTHYRVDTETCEKCNNLHAISLRLFELNDDATDFTESTLFEDLLISESYFMKIKDFESKFSISKTEENED